MFQSRAQSIIEDHFRVSEEHVSSLLVWEGSCDPFADLALHLTEGGVGVYDRSIRTERTDHASSEDPPEPQALAQS